MYQEQDILNDFTDVEVIPGRETIPPRDPDEENLHEVPKKPRVKIRELLDGTILVREDMRKQLPYVLFLTFLGIIYIGNRFYAEKMIRQINMVKTEVSNLRAEQITTTAELMNISRPSEVAALVRERNLGLSESVQPPIKLIKK